MKKAGELVAAGAAEVLRATFIDQDRLDQLMHRAGRMRVPQDVLQAFDLEWHGGFCPRCGQAWIPVEVEEYPDKRDGKEVMLSNRFARFRYYAPHCRCFPRCERVATGGGRWRSGCGKLLMEETLMGLKRCANCRGEIGP